MISGLISVVLPVYNSNKYLGEAIESILGQSYRNWELIIIDDGSTDGSAELAKSFQIRDPRIRVWQNSNNFGVTASLNQGLKLAQGEFFARHDADDVSDSSRFSHQIERLATDPESLTFTYANILSKSSVIPRVSRVAPKLFAVTFRNPFVHGTLCARLETIRSLAGYRDAYLKSQDLDLILRAYSKKISVKMIAKPLYSLRLHSESVSTRSKDEQKYFARKARWDYYQRVFKNIC